MNALQRAIDVVGSQSELAKAIGCVPQVVNNWLRRENVPAEHCPAIEKATDGAVRCEDLRPDVDWAYLRNSATAPAVTCAMADPRQRASLPSGDGERRDDGRRTDDHPPQKEAA